MNKRRLSLTFRGSASTMAREMGVEEISLLPYHEGGQTKSQQIGKPYHLPGARCPGEEHVQRLVKIASEMGVSVTVGNYKGDVSLELYPYFDTPVEAGLTCFLSSRRQGWIWKPRTGSEWSPRRTG